MEDENIDIGEYEEEYEEYEEQEESPDIKPELKRLYQQHPECNIDYIEQVIPKIQLQIIPGGEKSDSNHRTYPFLTNFEKFIELSSMNCFCSFVIFALVMTDILELVTMF